VRVSNIHAKELKTKARSIVVNRPAVDNEKSVHVLFVPMFQ
jgi:hypothetical protein